MNKSLFIAIGAILMSPMAYANFYVSGKVGATDFVIDTSQYLDYSPDSPRSVVVDGVISDVNAAYRAAVGYDFVDTFRLEFEYGYGKYSMGGQWTMNTKNFANGNGIIALPPNVSYPSTYSLVNKVHTFVLNGYYNIFTFDRRYKNGLYTDINSLTDCCYDALYVVATIGMAHIRDSASVGINTTLAWGGYPLSEDASNTLNRFVYGAGVGLSFGLSQSVSVDISYKYTKLGDYNMGLTRRDYSSHDMMLGLRYEF